MHPNKAEGVRGHSAKLHKYTRDYGDANPHMKKLAAVDELKKEGGEDAVGYGADAAAARASSDRPARRSQAANPVATYKKGGRAEAKARARKRADGGDVSSIETANRDQAMSNPNRARGGRTKTKHKGTHVNVIVAPQGGGNTPAIPPVLPVGANPAVMPPRPPMAPPGPMAGGPPMMPPGAGGPPMMPPPGAMPPGAMPPRARGGKVEHSDAKEDRAMIKGMVKSSALKGRARGGKVHMTAGAESGPGRLEKTEARARNKAGDKQAEI